jgi:hypothetical protein
MEVKYNKVKIKISHDKSCLLKREELSENLTSIITSTLETTRATPFSVLRADRTSTPRKFLGTHFY